MKKAQSEYLLNEVVIEGRHSKYVIKQIRKLILFGFLSYLQMFTRMNLPIVLDQGFM